MTDYFFLSNSRVDALDFNDLSLVYIGGYRVFANNDVHVVDPFVVSAVGRRHDKPGISMGW
jgi:hypothetical protein